MEHFKMVERPVKKHPTIACCGLDCGMCTRYYTDGRSRCPGCAGEGFYDVMPGCGYITCCVKNKGLEVCGECDEFPCKRFDKWLDKCEEHDSFVTHRNVKNNLEYIKKNGLKRYLNEQSKRIALLENFIENYNDGRSRSFYCLATTLLTLKSLNDSLKKADQQIQNENIGKNDKKSKADILKEYLNASAAREGVELKLRKKGGKK
jgi:hypothetical protein